MEQPQQGPLGALVQTRREALGISRAELAAQCKAGRTFIYHVEAGSIRRPDPRKLARLGRALDLPLTRLYTLAGYPAGRQLPSFQPYLRDRYRSLPPEAIKKLQQYFDEIREQYGTQIGPDDGEDEGSDVPGAR